MKIVIFKSPYEYCDFMCDSLMNHTNVVVIEPVELKKHTISDVFLYFLMRVNKEKFYQSLVKKYVLSKISYDEDVCFVSFDSSEWTGTDEFLLELKKNYPNSKTAIIIYNSIENNLDKVKQYNERFDYQFTFDPYDAISYDWHHFQGLMPVKKAVITNKIYDVCFIGNDKGRYSKLKQIYVCLTDAGFKCYFHITSQLQPTDSVDQKILFKDGLSFEETLQIEKESKSVLDVTSVLDRKQGLSLRILEAIYCNCKIISNNIYTQDVSEIKEMTLLFDELPDISKLYKLINDEKIIDIKGLNLGFESIFRVLSSEK